MSIKENALPTQGILPSSWFLRMVSDTGYSKKIASSLVKWTIDDITSLQESLDGKQDLSSLKNMLSYIDSYGQTIGSGFLMGTISDAATMDAAFCGLYTAPIPFSIDNIGDIYGLLAISKSTIGESYSVDNSASSQLIFTSNGIYLRNYSTTWGLFRYVGGGIQPQPVTREEIIGLMDDNELVQGTKYVITDHPNDDGIIVEAASSNQISQYAIRLACQPKYYTPGTYATGDAGADEVWEGVYEYGSVVTIDHIYIYAGVVYKNLTGDDTTPSGEYILSSTDWEAKAIELGSYYDSNICECIYKIGLTSSPIDEDCGVIQRQTDIKSNVLGEELTGDPTLLQRTRIDYNDWGHPGISRCKMISCWSNKEDCSFTGIEGDVYIHDNIDSNIASVRITDDSVIIYNNDRLTLFDCDISGNIYHNTALTITYSDINSYVATNNTFTITDCETNSPITGNSSGSITSSYIFGTFSGNDTCTVTKSTLNDDFTNNTGTFNIIESNGLIDNNTLTASRLRNVSEISGNTGVFSDVQTEDADCPIKNNTSIILSECRLVAGNVAPHLGIQNCEDIEISSADIWGGITSCNYCDFNNFKIESGTAYITLCDYLKIKDSYIRGVSWISQVSGTGYNELASSISGCTIDGELEQLGAGYGSGTMFTLTDCVIGKSGDIKRSNGYVKETRLDGNITDVTTLAVDNSVIETQSDFDDYVALTITDSYIGSSVDGNQTDPATITATIIRSHIYSNTIFTAAFNITDSEVRGSFQGTAVYSEISGTFEGTATNSKIFKSTIGGGSTVIVNSKLYNCEFNVSTINNCDISGIDCSGVFTETIIEDGAVIYVITNNRLLFTNTRIGSRANIFKDDYGTLTITDTYFNGKYECNSTSNNNESLLRCTVEYGAEIVDTLNLTLEDCKLLYGSELTLTDFSTYKLFKTLIDYDATGLTLSEDTTLGTVGACAYITGVIEIEDAATVGGDGYNVVASGTSLTATTVKENGVSISINSTCKWIEIIVDSPGWYNIHYLASAKSNTATDVETAAFFSSTINPQTNNIKSYIIQDVTNAKYANSSLDGKIYFSDTTPLKFLYKSDVDVLMTIYKITINIEKEL